MTLRRLIDRKKALENQILRFSSVKFPATPLTTLQPRFELCQQCTEQDGAGCKRFGCVDQAHARRAYFEQFCNPSGKCPANHW